MLIICLMLGEVDHSTYAIEVPEREGEMRESSGEKGEEVGEGRESRGEAWRLVVPAGGSVDRRWLPRWSDGERR